MLADPDATQSKQARLVVSGRQGFQNLIDNNAELRYAVVDGGLSWSSNTNGGTPAGKQNPAWLVPLQDVA